MAGVVQGCKCAEKLDRPINYKGDIELLHDFGVKQRYVLDLPAVRLANPKRIADSVRRRQDGRLWRSGDSCHRR